MRDGQRRRLLLRRRALLSSKVVGEQCLTNWEFPRNKARLIVPTLVQHATCRTNSVPVVPAFGVAPPFPDGRRKKKKTRNARQLVCPGRLCAAPCTNARVCMPKAGHLTQPTLKGGVERVETQDVPWEIEEQKVIRSVNRL